MLKRIPFFNFVMGSSQSRESAVEIIKRWDTERKALIFDSGRAEVTLYLEAVAKVQLTSDREELNQIIPMVVTRLTHEFQTVLTKHSELVMGSNSTTELTTTITDSTSYQFLYEDIVRYDPPSDEVILYLKNIAATLNSCGRLEVCIQIYKTVRKPFVEFILGRFRLDELKAGGTKTFLTEELKMEIERWMMAAKVCIKKLFDKERSFASEIFSGPGSTSTHEGCFLSVAKDAAVSLLSFPASVSSSHQPSERLNVILILYDAVVKLSDDVNKLFPLESGKGIRNNIAATSTKLGNQVGRMVSDLEEAVLHEKTTISTNDRGVVHKLTRYVLGYINGIVNHRGILTKLIVLRPSKIVQGKTLPDELLRDPNSLGPLGLHLVLIIAVLHLNLGKKSKDYNDVSLGHLFMMNNVNHIVHEIEESKDLKEMIGGDYLDKLRAATEMERESYENSTCHSLLKYLKEEKLYVSRCCTYRVSTSALRNNMTQFDATFERIKSLQSYWIVPDDRLREKLRSSMVNKLKPAYEGFLDKFKNQLESGENNTKCFQNPQRIDVKYQVQDLKDLVEKNLFSSSQN